MATAAPRETSAINRFFDAWPRPRIFRGSCERPTFRSLGVAGYHVALVATLGTGLLAGRSLLVLATLAAVCAASFFAWAYLRRAITGREQLVLLEHVWIAELASAGTLSLMREPILPYLDAVSVGLAVFLAFGRTGCLLVGCCHGHPASIGIRYGEDCVRDGFPAYLAGVRLFPVQALEALILVGLSLIGLALVPGPTPGRALSWFLVAYAVLRFGLESLRADERPHFLGLSQARWMAIVEFGAGIAICERGAPPTRAHAIAALLLLGTLFAALLAARRLDPRHRLLTLAHLAELRALVRTIAARAEAAGGPPVPEVGRTERWVSAGVSLLDGGRLAHVSIALPLRHCDMRLLCDVAAGALPELDPASGRTGPATLLHVRVPLPLAETPPPAMPTVADALYGATLRRLQGEPEQAFERLDAPEEASPAPVNVVMALPPTRASSDASESTNAHHDRPVKSESPWVPRIPVAVGEARPTWRRVSAAKPSAEKETGVDVPPPPKT